MSGALGRRAGPYALTPGGRAALAAVFSAPARAAPRDVSLPG
ncbi:hypothetical protein [Microtetraspora malaysiensis]|uniref:ArsR family transcriptional regulator n=1 Tax=Microtetraspora malaysiensis TaxID=161358 RepID=A0ABW6SZ40_9ACTN